MSNPYLLETIHDADSDSGLQADLFGRLYNGVVYIDAEIVRTYVHDGQTRRTHRIPSYLEVRRRYLSRKVEQWVKLNKADIQATVHRRLRQLSSTRGTQRPQSASHGESPERGAGPV